MIETGKAIHFDVDMYLASVEQMVQSDEVERALNMLDNMPAWYRDHYPQKAQDLKDKIYKQFYTIYDYAYEDYNEHKTFENITDVDFAAKYLWQTRAQGIIGLCKHLNSQNKVPHIVEMGSGNHWLEHALKICNCKYTYYSQTLNRHMQTKGSPKINADYNIFICFEVIEHLWEPKDIYHYSLKHEVNFDFIMLSTPKYSFGGGCEKWQESNLGHLRAYTPTEFSHFAVSLWPGYKWDMIADSVMCMTGEKILT